MPWRSLALSFLLALTPVPVSAASLSTVWLTGDPVEGLAPGESLVNLPDAPLSNGRGDVLVKAVAQDAAGDLANVLVLVRSGEPARVVARDFTRIDGVPFSGLATSRTFLSESGHAAVLGANVWFRAEPGGELQKVLRTGDPAPGFAAETVRGLASGGSLGPSGILALPGSTSGGSSAIWTADDDGVEAVVRSGQPVGPDAPGVEFFGLCCSMSVNAQGDLRFFTTLTGSGVNASNDLGVGGTDETGEISLRVRDGDPAPGLPGVTLASVRATTSQIDDRGRFVFRAELVGAGVTDDDDVSFWLSHPDGSADLLFREGDSVRGADGATFAGTQIGVLTDRGDFAGQGPLSGPGVTPEDDVAIVASISGGELRVAVREGDPVPGLPGVAFDLMIGPGMDEDGNVFFQGFFRGDVEDDDQNGLFAVTPSGRVVTLVRTGDPVEVAPGEFRTVSGSLRAAGSHAGTLTFAVRFTDGTFGVLRATVPEPRGLLLLMAVGVGLRSASGRAARGRLSRRART